MLQNHRIIELTELEGILKGHPVQLPFKERGHLQLNQGAFSSIQLDVNVSMDGTPSSSLGNLFQCSTTFIINSLLFISSLNLPSFSMKPFSLGLSQQTLLKSLSLSYL